MTFKIIHTLTLAFCIAGCVTNYAPESLSDVKRNECVIVSEKITYDKNGRLEGVIAGSYRAEKEDVNGVFYRGPARAVFYNGNVGATKFFVKPGGIWLPKRVNQKPKLYSYFETESYSVDDINSYATQVSMSSINNGVDVGPSVVGSAIGGAIVNAMIQADVGKIFPWSDINDADFIKKISNIQSCSAEGGESVSG